MQQHITQTCFQRNVIGVDSAQSSWSSSLWFRKIGHSKMDVSAEVLQTSAVCAGQSCRAFDKPAMFKVYRLAQSLLRGFKHKVAGLLHAAGHRPVLHHYSNDASSYLVKHSTTARHYEGHLYVHRRGQTLAEFLCERSYYTYFDWCDEQHSVASVFLPRSLAKGTTAMHCHAASSTSFESLKSMGHRGISIEHHCYDRAKLSALVDLAHAKHALWMEDFMKKDEASPMDPNKDWVLGTGCALHDASKALQWSLARHITYPDLLKDLYVVIESCRSGYDLMETSCHSF